MRVLLLGATGHIGDRTVNEFLRRDDLEQLTLSGRNVNKLSKLSDRFGGRGRVDTVAFDIRARDEASAQMRRHDVVVSCAGPGYELEVPAVEAALDAGTHYISLNDDADAAVKASSLAGAADSGTRVVSGCGASPGLSNLLVALGAEELDRVDEIQIAIGASTRDAGGPAAELHFVTMLTQGDSGAGGGSRVPHPVYFPEPVGWIETFACSHPEETAFERHLAQGATVEFRIGLAEKAVMDVVRASVASRVTVREPVKRAWLKLASPLQPLLERLGPGTGGWTGIRVDIHGRSGDRARTISYGVVDHLVNLASIALVEGAMRLPGASGSGSMTPEEVFDPKDFLRAAADRGVSFARLRPHSL